VKKLKVDKVKKAKKEKIAKEKNTDLSQIDDDEIEINS